MGEESKLRLCFLVVICVLLLLLLLLLLLDLSAVGKGVIKDM